MVDELATALIDSIAARHPKPVSVKVPSYSALFERAHDVTYDDGRVDKLIEIRDRFGEQCLAYAEIDKSPFESWCDLPDAVTLTSIVCGHAYYDPTGRFRAFDRAWRETKRVAA